MTIHSVSDINSFIKGIFDKEASLNNILVRGEISNFKKYPSGHCYFSLKDEDSALKCVMFKSWARFLRFEPQNGMKVIAGGNISVYERDGVYQLYVNNMQPDGKGELAVAYEQLKERLEREGLFSADKKKRLPKFPHTIGVITSEAGAVLHDIYTVTRRRARNVNLVLYPVAVQGAGAAEQIAHAISVFNKKYKRADVLIVGRGGGSAEDLWAFNEEITVRAIAASRIPVISAVGHETDITLADFVADVRAATPSQAAELAVPDMKNIQERLGIMRARLAANVKKQLNNKQQRIQLAAGRLAKHLSPQRLLAERRQALDTLNEKLISMLKLAHERKRKQLELQMNRLELLNPLSILRRGYGVVEKDGAVIQSIGQLKNNDEISIRLHDGRIAASISRVEE